MNNQRDVIEYIVMPPLDQRDAVMAAKERFEHYLSNRFPGNTFKISPFVPVGDGEDFCVLPIMNYQGDDGHSYMCNQPKRWFMQEIAQACREFDLKGLRSFAA